MKFIRMTLERRRQRKANIAKIRTIWRNSAETIADELVALSFDRPAKGTLRWVEVDRLRTFAFLGQDTILHMIRAELRKTRRPFTLVVDNGDSDNDYVFFVACRFDTT